jgi:hypothetical protein
MKEAVEEELTKKRTRKENGKGKGKRVSFAQGMICMYCTAERKNEAG